MNTDKTKYTARPVGHLLLVRPDPVVESTESGIFLAVDKKLERGAGTVGTVLEVGPEAFLAFQNASGIPMNARKPWVNPGDKVYYAKYAGKWIDDAATKEELLFIRDEDILGLV